MINPDTSSLRGRRLMRAKRAIAKLAKLGMEALMLYVALPMAEMFHASKAQWRVADGSNRCIGGEQPLYDPIEKRYRRVDEIDGDFHVLSRNPETGELEPAKAGRPFVKAYGSLYRVSLSNGESMVTTLEHRVLAAAGRWVSVRDAYAGGVSCISSASGTARRGRNQVARISRFVALTRTVHAERPESECRVSGGSNRGVLRHCLEDTSPQFRHNTQSCFLSPPATSCGSGTKPAHRQSGVVQSDDRPQNVESQPESCVSHPRSIWGISPLAPALGALSWLNRVQGCLSRYSPYFYPYGGPLHSAAEDGQDAPPSPVDVPVHTRRICGPAGHADDLGRTASRIHWKSSHRPSIQGVQGRVVAPISAVESRISEDAAGRLWSNNRISKQFENNSCVALHTAIEVPLDQEDLFFSCHPSQFSVDTEQTTCTIAAIEYLRQGEIWDISVEPHANYLAGGLTNANSAKTLSAAVEYARAHCGCDPYNKYPKTDGRSLAVGLDNDHLALTMFPKVFSSGAGIPFNIIRDEHTRLWRAVRPDPANPMAIDPYDLAYKEKWKAAPPLIPDRMIEKIAYEKVNQGVPRLVKMKNGWQGSWRPAGSTAKPPQGAAYDLAWIDEHIDNEGFYTQICRGLMDRSGCAMWSATPERANPELIGLRDRADEGDSRVGRFTFYLDENPYIPPEEKAAFLASLPDDDARRVHYYGDYAVTGRRVYAGEFNPMEQHGYEPEAIPRNHTRYAVVDPGRQWCGNLLASVDPNEKHTRLYDAWIIRKCNGRKWARGLAEHCQGERLEAIVMDRRMGIQKPVGANDDRTTAQYYWEALKEIDWLPRREGPLNGFFPGSDDIPAREEALIGWMQHRDYGPHAGSCRLQIPRGQLRELEDHIKWAQYDNKTGKKRMKLDKGRDELVQCAEYLAAFDPGYHEPESPRIKQENRRAELIDKYEGGTRRGARSGVNVG